MHRLLTIPDPSTAAGGTLMHRLLTIPPLSTNAGGSR